MGGGRTTNKSYSQILLKENGYLEIPRTLETVNTSHLYDPNRQIEISFLNKLEKEKIQIGYKVIGIPLTYLTFSAETTEVLYEIFKNTLATCLKNTNLDTSVCSDYRELYQSRLKCSTYQQVRFLLNNFLEDEYLGNRL